MVGMSLQTFGIVLAITTLLSSFAYLYMSLKNDTDFLRSELLMLAEQSEEMQEMLDWGRDCILDSGDRFPRNRQCWGDMKRQLWLKELAVLERVPQDERMGKFAVSSFNWAPFDILPPTYECDLNTLKRVGGLPNGDGGKWICDEITLGPNCAIISIGSNGDFTFEKAMFEFTKGQCNIYTFDCTGVWEDPSTKFYPWCVTGSDYVDDSNGRIYKKLSTITSELGITDIAYLKMDIEGYEWSVLPDIFKESNRIRLPQQISFELHFMADKAGLKEGEDWLERTIQLAKLIDHSGYRIAINEWNVYCYICSEFVIVRR